MQTLNERAQAVRLFIMDVDGVLTDGRVFFTASGEELKAFNTLDGQGLKLLHATGVKLALITGGDASCVKQRALKLNVAYYYAGIEDKSAALSALLKESGFSEQACAYMGDDMVDLPVMRRVVLALSVPKAPKLVRQCAHYVTACAGGDGAVREAAELIMQAQGTLDPLIANLYLS